jgi:hypothetical protein
MLVIDVGVKFRTVSVKCANIIDQDCSMQQGRTLGGVWGGAKPPLASECHQKSVPFLLDTVRKLGPKIRVQEVIFTSVSEFGPTTQQLVGKML